MELEVRHEKGLCDPTGGAAKKNIDMAVRHQKQSFKTLKIFTCGLRMLIQPQFSHHRCLREKQEFFNLCLSQNNYHRWNI